MEKEKEKQKYYQFRMSIPTGSKYNYLITELQSLSILERNSLVRDLLSKYYSEKLHREMESENNKESTKAAGDDVSAKKKLDDVEKTLSKMLKKQKQLESQNQKLLGELEEQRQINKELSDKKESDVQTAEVRDILSSDTTAGAEENSIDTDTLDEIFSFMDTLNAT
jgi:hypothetical protein